MAQMSDGQMNLKTIETQRVQSRIEDFMVTGMSDTNRIALVLGIDVKTVEAHKKELMDKWVGDKPKKVREKRALMLNMLERIIFVSYVEFEKSKQGTESVSTTYDPKTCPVCEGAKKVPSVSDTGRKTRVNCSRCEGKGVILVETVTRKVSGQTGDPRYMTVALAATREMIRLNGLYRPKKISAVENQQNNSIHVTMNAVVDKWKNAPNDLLLEAKGLIDKLANVMDVRPAGLKTVEEGD
jgi:uncharacterized protein YoaH (UPF0181 family)